MDDDERKKKLQAGRDRLAKFQKQKTSPEKKVKKKKKKKVAGPVSGSQDGANGESGHSTTGPLSDDSYDQVDSSFASDFSSPLHSEDSDSHLDGGPVIACPSLDASTERILELEETLEGKVLALSMMQQELDEANSALAEVRERGANLRAGAGGVPAVDNGAGGPSSLEGGDSTWQSASIQPPQEQAPSDREREYKAAIEQYNLKIMEFQTALAQRDDIIKQLSDNLQGVLQSRDEVQKEAASQADQLSDHIQSLKDQLRDAGETLQTQGTNQVAELAAELTQATDQVMKLRKTIEDKDTFMQELAGRYAAKSQELYDLKEEQETLVRQHAGDITALKQQVSELQGDDSPTDRVELIEMLRAELDGSYGHQMMLMKQQLMDNHQQDLSMMQQQVNDLQVLARTNAGTSDKEINELRKQLVETNQMLGVKDEQVRGLQMQLEKLVAEFSRQNDELEHKHAAELEILKGEFQKEMKVKLDEMESEKEKDRENHAMVINDLNDKLHQTLNDNKELTEIRDTYEGQITRLMKELEEHMQEGGDPKAVEEEKKEHARKVDELEEEVQRLNNDNKELTQIKEAFEEQIKRLSSELESRPDIEEVNTSTNKEDDDKVAEYEEKIQGLEKELEDAKMRGPSMETLDGIREQMEAEIKRDYDDMMDDLRYNQTAELKRLNVQLGVEYEDKLKDAIKVIEDQVDQRVQNVQTEKQLEFVAELQKVRAELQEQFDERLKQAIEDEHSKVAAKEQAGKEAAKKEPPQSGGLHAELKDVLLTRLQAEVQDLSEVRDDLLLQLEVSNQQNQTLRGELAAATYEKGILEAEAEHLKEELQGIQFQADASADSPFYDNERDDLTEKLRILNSRLQSQEQEHEIEVSGYQARIEALKQEIAETNLAYEHEKGELDGKVQELSQMKEQMEPLQDQLAASSNKIGELQTQLSSVEDAHEEEMKQLREEKAQLASQLTEVQEEMERTTNSLPGVEEEEESRAKLEEKLLELEEEKKGVESLLEKAQVEVKRLQEEVSQAEEQIHDLEGEVCRQAAERNEMDEKVSEHEAGEQQLLSEKEQLQHQLETAQKEHEKDIEDLKSQLLSIKDTGEGDDIVMLKEERDSALGTLESLTDQNKVLDSRRKEMELQIASLEEDLTRQQSMQIVRDVEIMSQKEVFEEALADYERLVGELRAEKEEMRFEVEKKRDAQEVATVSDPREVASEEIVVEEVAPVAASSTAAGRDFESLPNDLECTLDALKSENEDMKEKLLHASQELESSLEREHHLKKDIEALKTLLQEGEEEKGAMEDIIQDEKEQIDRLRVAEEVLERENEELKETLEHQPLASENQAEIIANLQEDVARLTNQLEESQELFGRENKLLQEALQEERETTARLLQEGESPTSRDSLLQEIINLKQSLAHRDQTEHEMQTEKERQIGLLQETTAKLEQEKTDLHSKIADLEKRMHASEAISQEVQDTFGRQFMELQTEQATLKEQLEKQKNDPDEPKVEAAPSLDEQALREEALRCAKDMLLQKLEEKEAVEQRMLDEKMELVKQVAEQQRLEELLQEKDRLEQELARQKRALQAEVKELEQKLQDQERALKNEKLNMESELQQKDFELRKWEASFREQQLEYRSRDAFVKRRHENELDGMRSDSDREAAARLEGMRIILERQHAEAVARLRRDLQQEFTTREGRQAEKHLADISLIKAAHHTQLEELGAECEARIQELREQLEQERKEQIGAVKSVHERLMEQDQSEHLQTVQDLKDQHEWEMEALKGELDLKQQEVFEELKAKMETAFQQEKDALRHQCEAQAQKELDSVKASMEQIYLSQTESVRADLAREKAQALNELRRDLVLSHQEALQDLEQSWASRLEDERRQLAHRTDEAAQNSEELISQLQRRLSLEHKQVVQSLAEQWDQEAVERLEALRAEMETRYTQELEAERRSSLEKQEGEVEQVRRSLEAEHRSDVDLLLTEREMLVTHAEEMRQNLDKVHHKELDELRASLKAEYEQYVRAREQLEISRSQSEVSLIEELSMLRVAHQDLQQQYRAEVTALKVQLEQAGVPDQDQLTEENRELQTARTRLRAKLQEEHAEELNQLRVYFEQQVEETDQRWKTEMAELKALHEAPGGVEEEEPARDEIQAKRSDYSHAMMTLTHLSDSDTSSPPHSPPKFLEAEAELKQELRSQLDAEYQKDLRNLRQELGSQHEADMSRVRMEYDLQREEDLLQLENRLTAKHSLDSNDLEMDYLTQMEELRGQLVDTHSKELARLRLEAAAESARAVEEATGKLVKEHEEAMESLRTELEQKHAKEDHELRLEMSSELAGVVAEKMEWLRESLQEEHMQELESLRRESETDGGERKKAEEDLQNMKGEWQKEKEGWEKEKEGWEKEKARWKEDWEKERSLLIKASKEDVVEEVAKIVSDATIERALLQVEIDAQTNMLGSCLQELDQAKAKAAETLTDVDRLHQELTDTKEALHLLQESLKNGEAPELKELREALMRDYDNRLELITSTMNEEMDQLVRTTQEQARADLERMQADFAAQHQTLVDRFVEDQEKAVTNIRAEHQADLDKLKVDLQEEFAETQAQALEAQQGSLVRDKERELAELRERHTQELQELRVEMMKLTDEERGLLEEKMKEERRGVEAAQERMRDMEQQHEREKEELKNQMVAEHMDKFRQVTAELEASHQQQLEASLSSLQAQHHQATAALEDQHADQLSALNAAHDADLEGATGKLLEDHGKEIDELRNQLEAQKQKDIEELQMAFEEAKKMLNESHRDAIQQVEEEREQRLEKMRQEKEEALKELREEMNRSTGQEKGEMDQLMKEKQEQWTEEKEALRGENDQLKENNASLLQQISEHEAVIGRSAREHEEGRALLAMLRTDLDRLGTERDSLQQTNNHLLRVLTQVVQTTMATENAITRRMGAKPRPNPSPPHGVDRRGDGRPSSPRVEQLRGAVGGDTSSDGDALHDTSVASMFSDEGLELSQHINESMFVGPELDSEGEEMITGATNRLHSAVEQLLDRFSDSSTESDQARPVQASGYASSRSSREPQEGEEEEEDDRLSGVGGDREAELKRRLQAEVREKERLAVELHKSEGLLDGITAEKNEVEEALSRAQERQHALAVEMQTLSHQLAETTQANQALQDAQDQFEQQRAVLAERLGLEDLGLIEENAQLRQQVHALTQEQADLEHQTARSRSYLEQELQALETASEEQVAGARSKEQEARLWAEDLQRQVEAAKKIHASHKQFMEQQSADREQEREEFQREIARLEEEQKQKEKPGGIDVEQLMKENQDLTEELRAVQESADSSGSRIQQLETEVSWKQDTVSELARQIKELERQFDEQKKLPARVNELEAELRGERHLGVEMRHEKEALQKQVYDQLLQISALQSELDAHKHGLDAQTSSTPSSAGGKAGEDSEGPMSLAHQWEQDKEALDRKDKEIADLVEQLDQFRAELNNKDEELGQLALQLEVASREQGSGRQDLQQEISKVKADNQRLRDELQAPSQSSLDQDLLDEKNLEIDQLTEQIQDLQSRLGQTGTRLGSQEEEEEEEEEEMVVEEVITVERRSAEASPLSPGATTQAEEMNQLRLDLERQLAAKDQEMSVLRQQLREEGDGVTSPSVREQLEQEVASLRQMMGVREREVAQLEAQLVRAQEQALPQREGAQAERDNEVLRATIEAKELEIVNLKIEVNQLEEAAFQSQQQGEGRGEGTLPPPGETSRGQRSEEQWEEVVQQLEEELNKERSRASEMEADYQRRVANLQGLSPGKTLEQKLAEIRAELTRDHQQHVADIQVTMAREAEHRLDQLRQEHATKLQVLQELQRGQVQEAVLRTNRDLLAAHGQERAAMEEEHRRQIEELRAAAASPVAHVNSLGDVGNLLSKEVENTARLDSNLLGHLRLRQGGVGREQSPGEGEAMTNGEAAPEHEANGEIPPRLQSVLARLHSEGLQVLSLSDLRYLRQATSPRPAIRRGTDVASLQNAWENEKQALLDAIQALKDLITHTTAGLRNDESDWRGDLLRAIQAVFDQERESLLAELRTHVVASGDQDLGQVQLLERRIREQESHHKAAMEQLYGVDRASLLAEVHQLRVGHNTARIQLQEVRQRSAQQLSALEAQSSNREKQVKRQLETMEHKFRQERILADDLRTSLTVERQKLSQLGATLASEKRLSAELRDETSDLRARLDRLHAQRDDVERRMADVGSVAESALAALEAEKGRSAALADSLESEKRNVAKLHDALAAEGDRAAQGRERDQKLAKELRRELDTERLRSAEMSKAAEAARERAEGLSQDLEAERTQSATTVSSEKVKLFELKRALDVEKTRCQEAHTALQREQALNTQLHESLDQERRSFADDSLRDKSTLSDLQTLLGSERQTSADLGAAVERLKARAGQLERALHSQRAQGEEATQREKEANRRLQENLDKVNTQCRDLSEKLAAAQSALSRADAERERLAGALGSQKEQELDQEARREGEREAEEQRAREREKEKETDRQRQRERDQERQLEQEKRASLEEELRELKGSLKRLERENQRLQDPAAGQELHRSLDRELSNGSGSPYRRPEGGAATAERASLDLYKGQLESVRQRLQLMAVKQQEELSRIERVSLGVSSVPSSMVQTLRSVDGGLIELITELRQIHAALTLLSESQPPLVTVSASRINERLLEQNAEMSSYVSQLSSEKSELRGALSKLEEEIWAYRQRETQRNRHARVPSSDTDAEAALARERLAWAQECRSTQNALQEAEQQIVQLKLDLERGALSSQPLGSGEQTEQQQQQKIQRLYGKYLRAESFRKALVYQKKYLLLLLGGFQDCEQATLALIAKMGAFPSPEDHGSGAGSGSAGGSQQGRSRAFSRFRSAVRVVIATCRLKFLVRKWRRATRAGSREIMGSGLTPPTTTTTTNLTTQGQRSTSATHRSRSLVDTPLSETRPSTHPSGAPYHYRYASPLRGSPGLGETPLGGDSPPVRDRGAPRLINGMAHHHTQGGAVGRTRLHAGSTLSQRPHTSPLPHSDTTPRSRLGAAYNDRLGAGAAGTADLNESEGAVYIRKIETLQQTLSSMAGRKTTMGGEHGSSTKYSSFSKR